MAKKIKLYPAPHVELRVHVSDEMIQDYRDCKRIAKETKLEEGKDCDTCSWSNVQIGDVGMCELKEMERLLEDEHG